MVFSLERVNKETLKNLKPMLLNVQEESEHLRNAAAYSIQNDFVIVLEKTYNRK